METFTKRDIIQSATKAAIIKSLGLGLLFLALSGIPHVVFGWPHRSGVYFAAGAPVVLLLLGYIVGIGALFKWGIRDGSGEISCPNCSHVTKTEFVHVNEFPLDISCDRCGSDGVELRAVENGTG